MTVCKHVAIDVKKSHTATSYGMSKYEVCVRCGWVRECRNEGVMTRWERGDWVDPMTLSPATHLDVAKLLYDRERSREVICTLIAIHGFKPAEFWPLPVEEGK